MQRFQSFLHYLSRWTDDIRLKNEVTAQKNKPNLPGTQKYIALNFVQKHDLPFFVVVVDCLPLELYTNRSDQHQVMRLEQQHRARTSYSNRVAMPLIGRHPNRFDVDLQPTGRWWDWWHSDQLAKDRRCQWAETRMTLVEAIPISQCPSKVCPFLLFPQCWYDCQLN